MNVVVVGTGYVGLVAGTCFAEIGHRVVCVDKDSQRIDMLNDNEVPIYEPGLNELVIRNSNEGRLTFTTNLAEAIQNCLLIFFCVGTPENEDGSADISAVLGVAEEVARNMPGYRIIVNKSTCPIGTTEKIEDTIRGLTSEKFDVVSNPEFLREGSAIEDFLRPDRVVVGCDDVRVAAIMEELYAPVLRTDKPFISISRRSAELSKYACNTMLAARISLMNELACLCEVYGADVGDLRRVVGSDERLGPQYLFPSLGFGGSCFPKDVAACAKLARDADLPGGILDATLYVNDRQVKRFISRVFAYYDDVVEGKVFAIWGAAFKARTDDVRCAPALRIIDALLEHGAQCRIYDPAAANNLRELYGDRVAILDKCYETLQGCDALIIATEWREFQSPDYSKMADLLSDKVIFDGRNLYNPIVVKNNGLNYLSIGRVDVGPE